MSHQAWWGDPGCTRIDEGLYRIPLSMPNDGLRAVSIYALESDDGLVLIDGGWAVGSAMDELTAALASIDRAPEQISDIFVTHIHRDHYTFAVKLRERYGARVHLGQAEAPGLAGIQQLRSNVPTTSIRELVRSGAGELAGQIEVVTRTEPFDVADWQSPDVWLEPGPLNIAGWDLHAVHTPGHTKGHLVFHDVQRALLFSGDHVLPTITPSIGFELGEWDLPLKHYLASLELLLERDDAMLLPAHGHAGGSVHDRANALLEHHRVRFDQVFEALSVSQAASARAVCASEVAGLLMWTRRGTPLAQLDAFNRMIAICETIAHLDVLVDRGDVVAGQDAGVDWFSW